MTYYPCLPPPPPLYLSRQVGPWDIPVHAIEHVSQTDHFTNCIFYRLYRIIIYDQKTYICGTKVDDHSLVNFYFMKEIEAIGF